MQHHIGPFGQPLGVGLQLLAQCGMGPRAALAHGDDEMTVEEDRGLAIGDAFLVLQGSRAGHDKQHRSECLRLGRAAARQRVFDCQGVQAIAVLQQGQFRRSGIGHADPVELAVGGGQVTPLQIERGIGDLSRQITPCRNNGHAAPSDRGVQGWQSPPMAGR